MRLKRTAYFNAWTLAILASLAHVMTAADDTVIPGRHLFIGISGTALTAAESALLHDVQPAGVVLLGANVRDEAQTRALVASIKDAAGAGAQIADPPLIAVDQEGGRINRLRLDDAPSAAALGDSGDAAQARTAGIRYAAACRERGIGILLSPVLDVRRDGGNAVIGDRAFSADPALVEKMGLAFAQGVMEGGAIPCGKHFPGHGSTKQDSHRALAVLEDTADTLQATLRPFHTCAVHGIPMLMTGHIAAPALGDPKTPASLSRRVLGGLVREQWRYDGVLVTDDINMGALPRDAGAVAVQALAAGNDAVMYLDPRPERIRNVVQSIANAVADGTLSTEQLARSEARLEALSDWLRVNEFLVKPVMPGIEETSIAPLIEQQPSAAPQLPPETLAAPAPIVAAPEDSTAAQDSDTKKSKSGKQKKRSRGTSP